MAAYPGETKGQGQAVYQLKVRVRLYVKDRLKVKAEYPGWTKVKVKLNIQDN